MWRSRRGESSISAWVNLSSLPTANATVAGQDGNENSAFSLQYNHTSTGNPGWSFSFPSSDTANATVTSAYASGATANTWTHLVGEYYAGLKLAQLYVNGVLVASASNVASWGATGPFTVGRDKTNGSNTDFFPGMISDVQTWNYALSQDQITALSQQIH